jgi:anti-anti-sigma factor
MRIERVSPEELLVTLLSSPSAATAQTWIDQIKSELTGDETLARVDLTHLDIISSLGVSVIVGLFKSMEKQGGTIQVQVPNESMLRVFELFKLDDLFEVKVVSP